MMFSSDQLMRQRREVVQRLLQQQRQRGRPLLPVLFRVSQATGPRQQQVMTQRP